MYRIFSKLQQIMYTIIIEDAMKESRNFREFMAALRERMEMLEE